MRCFFWILGMFSTMPTSEEGHVHARSNAKNESNKIFNFRETSGWRQRRISRIWGTSVCCGSNCKRWNLYGKPEGGHGAAQLGPAMAGGKSSNLVFDGLSHSCSGMVIKHSDTSLTFPIILGPIFIYSLYLQQNILSWLNLWWLMWIAHSGGSLLSSMMLIWLRVYSPVPRMWALQTTIEYSWRCEQLLKAGQSGDI